MRVLHVIDSLAPRRGGPPAVAAALAAAQAQGGHDVALAFEPTTPGELEPLARSTPGFGRVRVVELPPARGRLQRATAAHIDGPVAEELKRAEIAHLHGVWEPPVRRAGRLCERANVPYVLLPHGMLKRWALAVKPFKKKVALALGYRRLLDRAAAVQALNEEERRELAPLGLEKRAFVLPNGAWPVEPGELPPPGEFRAAHNLGDAPFAFYLSRLHPGKGLDLLAEAFDLVAAQHPTARLVVAGPDDGVLAELQRYKQASPHGARVTLLGPQYGRDKLRGLVDATVFVLPSRNEAFPVAVLDALGVGTPAVVTRTCHFPEVGSEGAGVVVELEARALADALLTVLSDDAKRAEMGVAARALAARYAWPDLARACVARYAEVLSRVTA